MTWKGREQNWIGERVISNPPWEVLEHRQPIRAVLAWDGRPGPLCPCPYQLYVGCPERKGMPFDEATVCRKAHREGAGSRRQ